jgi:hypothetical protein
MYVPRTTTGVHIRPSEQLFCGLSGGSAFRIIGKLNQPIYVALHALNCCHAKNPVAAGIWYT